MNKSELVGQLETVLATSYALYAKTQNFHWNVTGPNFMSLHAVFEEQYTDLAGAIDEAAELIRGLGYRVPAIQGLLASNDILKNAPDIISTKGMVEILGDDQAKTISVLQSALSTAQKYADEVVSDFLIGRQAVHRKNRCILNAISE